MERFPLVSVAVITYNQKNFLRECIESCLSQDYPNFEIVVADDCSTDGTQDLLLQYQVSHPGKFVLRMSEENRGITANSNLAHFACSGKYIAWMGGDDVMLPSKIRRQVEFMEKHPECTICYHDLDVFDSDSNETLYFWSKKNKPREGDISTVIKYGVFNGACSSMVRADKTPLIGYNTLLPVASDWCYWIDSLANGGVIRYIPHVLARYRRHKGNVTRKKAGVGQNKIDHLNTCNYVISKYPVYFKEAMFSYSRNIRSLRHSLPYLGSLFFSVKVARDLKALSAILVLLISLGKIRP